MQNHASAEVHASFSGKKTLLPKQNKNNLVNIIIFILIAFQIKSILLWLLLLYMQILLYIKNEVVKGSFVIKRQNAFLSSFLKQVF